MNQIIFINFPSKVNFVKVFSELFLIQFFNMDSNTGQKPKKDPLNKHLLSTFKDVTDFINELA